MSSERTDVSCIARRSSVIFNDFAVGLENGDSERENGETLSEPEDPPKDNQESKYGDCYIFDYRKFGDKHNNRPGSEKDAKRLKNDFDKLKFDVRDVYENLSKQETLDALKEAAKSDYKQSNCLVCCFLTHGKEGSLLMSDGEYLKINNILNLFSRSSCESLAGKPKIFIFQACRGGDAEESVPCDSTDDASVIDFPDYLDFLLVYSTYKGKVTFRTCDPEPGSQNNHGSFFIDELCRTLEQFSEKLDLLQILTIVNYRVANFFESNTDMAETNKKKQMPCFTSRLTTEVKFNKKIPVIVSDDTRYFDRRRNLSSLGKRSTEHPLEDNKVYGIQNSERIKFLFLLNMESHLERHLSSLKASLNRRKYQTEEKKDWGNKELMDFLKIVAARDSSNTDCLICFIACKAKGDYLYDKNGKKFLMRRIVEQFTLDKCHHTLVQKPKIFIFLMLSPTKSWWPYAYGDGTDAIVEHTIPVHSDILEVAIRIQEFKQLKGVMEKFCSIFGTESSKDFLSQLTGMNYELVTNYGFYSPPNDLPIYHSLLKKCLYFSSLQRIFEFYFSSNDNIATFCLDSTLTKTLILNKPIS